MSQSVLLSGGAFLHGGSYFNRRIIIQEAARGRMLPPSGPAQSTPVMLFCVMSPSARQNCCLSPGPIWCWSWVWSHREHALRPAGTVHWPAALLPFAARFPSFEARGRGHIFPIFVSVLFHMSSQRNKWEIEHAHESEINPIWKLTWTDDPDEYVCSGDGFL